MKIRNGVKEINLRYITKISKTEPEKNYLYIYTKKLTKVYNKIIKNKLKWK